MNIPQIVEETYNEWQETDRPEDPYEINNGWCGEFAHEVRKKIHHPQVTEWDTRQALVTLEDERLAVAPGHIWIVDLRDMTHYDAEARAGVDFWYELPIFARVMDKIERKV